MAVRIGEVLTFTNVEPDKAQALKPLEEAAEVFGAWQVYEKVREDETQVLGEPHDWTAHFRDNLLDECADVVQATANLVAALGVEDFTLYMQMCERRNRERGRL